MKTVLSLTLLTTLLTLSVAPLAIAQPGTCVQGTTDCVCILNGNPPCTDAGTGHTCDVSFGWTNDSQTGYVCSATAGYSGRINGLRLGREPCSTTTAIAIDDNAGHTSYAQFFASDLASPNLANPCNGAVAVSEWRAYSDQDSTFQLSGDTLTITHVSQGAEGATLERTTLQQVSGGVWFEQSFTDLVTGEPTWQASGLLSGVSAA